KINANTEELKAARSATTGEQFNSLDERIDCEVDRINKKIEISFLEQEDAERHTIENTVEGMNIDMVIKGITLKNIFPHVRSRLALTNTTVEDGLFTITPVKGSFSNVWDANNPSYKPGLEYTIII
ncbi:hypothetical protein, partial [Clostridium perfringens]